MQDVELAGEYYEMGQQYGRILDRAGFSPQPASTEKAEFVHDCEPTVREHTPELLEELHGIADAGNWNVDLIKALPFALGYESGCSVVVVSGEHTVDGTTIFGRNYDFDASFADYGQLYRTQPTNRLASVGCSDHWTGRHGGVNEAGLAIGHTFVPNHGPRPGIMFGMAARWVLDTCRTVPEAVTFLERIPHARNTNFVIGNRTGEIAIVEASPERVVSSSVSTGFGAVTNHFLSESMKEHEPENADLSNSTSRHRNLTNWFENSATEIGVDEVQRVLADPAGGVCARESKGDDEPIETLWSWTAVLDVPEIDVAGGRPDETPYEPVEF